MDLMDVMATTISISHELKEEIRLFGQGRRHI